MNLNHRGRRASRKKFTTKADSAECVSSDRQMEEMVVLKKQLYLEMEENLKILSESICNTSK